MKKSIIALIINLILTTCVFAQHDNNQQPPSADEMAKKIVKELSLKVNLSQIKKDSITNALIAFFDDEKVYGKQGDKKIIDGLEKVRDEKVKKILPDANAFTAYSKIMEEMKNRKPPQHKPEGGPGNGGRQGGPKNEGF